MSFRPSGLASVLLAVFVVIAAIAQSLPRAIGVTDSETGANVDEHVVWGD